jgi:hypothetical protein
MKFESKISLVDIDRKVFDIKNESMPKGTWLWWFWLFFFNNPKTPQKPRQLMILWSTKNEREIDCNDVKLKIDPLKDRSNLCGAVAAWYFDGEKMHHNFLLEKCNIKILENGIYSDSATPTHFYMNKKKSRIKIGKDFDFVAEAISNHEFKKPIYQSSTYIGKRGYSIIKLNHLNLSGKVRNRPIRGSAYFQRILLTVPSPSWYWGIFHFQNGGVLTYFNPHFLGKSIKKDITFFDGKKMHTFRDIDVFRKDGKIPTFNISGENRNEKIKFVVNSYSHSSWTFKKKAFKMFPSKLVYNEYPAVISDLKLIDKKTGKIIPLSLGNSVGNAEHSTGFLL